MVALLVDSRGEKLDLVTRFLGNWRKAVEYTTKKPSMFSSETGIEKYQQAFVCPRTPRPSEYRRGWKS